MGVGVIVMPVILGVIGVSRCRWGRCHFQILPCSPAGPCGPFALVPSIAASAYRAAAAAEANEFAGADANFFCAASTQAVNSWSLTTRTAIGMKA